MAYNDNSNESITCLCAFIGSFTETQKNQLKTLVQNLSAVIDVVELAQKLVSQLVNYQDTLRLLEYKALAQVLSSTVSVIQIPVAFLFASTKQFADCPPVANLSSATKELQNFFFSDVEDYIYKIKLYEEALNKADNDLIKLGHVRDILSDLSEAIDACNLEQLKTAVV